MAKISKMYLKSAKALSKLIPTKSGHIYEKLPFSFENNRLWTISKENYLNTITLSLLTKENKILRSVMSLLELVSKKWTFLPTIYVYWKL